jgi:hypothetical protein
MNLRLIWDKSQEKSPIKSTLGILITELKAISK